MNPYLLSGLCVGLACILTLLLFIIWRKRSKIYTWCKAESIINSSPAATLNDMDIYDSVGCFPRWTAGNSMDDLKGEDDADKKQLRKLYILLYNPDDPDHAEAVEILVSLFASVGLEALGHGTYHKFTQWLDVAEMALSEEVSDFVVIISKQLQSPCHQYITHESKETFEKLLTERNMEYLPCVVLKHLRHRYISPYPSFRIHIMSLGFTNSDVIRDFINDRKSFVKSDTYCKSYSMKNTYIYYVLCSTSKEASKPSINNMTESMMSCIQRIYRSRRLGEEQREILENFLASPDGKKFESIIMKKIAQDKI